MNKDRVAFYPIYCPEDKVQIKILGCKPDRGSVCGDPEQGTNHFLLSWIESRGETKMDYCHDTNIFSFDPSRRDTHAITVHGTTLGQYMTDYEGFGFLPTLSGGYNSGYITRNKGSSNSGRPFDRNSHLHKKH
ncbi:hypothetical protein DSO57_1010811 [Entomophthora muscae]|uniref:Uncharacterized protein n=1 Tax=Entomophthora muscae TaxID=34485 RepID=A0ACC2RLB1_9FUNG|nr:hypothetical protein DSO57_1010811 [Entomophthora muscae]